MKKIMFTILLLFSCVYYVDAACTNDEINELKDEANNIKITYKHLGAVNDNDGYIYYNRFELYFRNVIDDFYIQFTNGSNNIVKLTPLDGVITDYFINGTYYFNVYSNNCNEKIKEIKVHVPKFYVYSLDRLCDGVDGDDFSLCGKYYEYDVSYEDFVTRVNYYRNIHDIGNYEEEEEEEKKEEKLGILNIILNFITKYQIYIVIGLVFILIILIILIVIRRKMKRKIL